MQREQEFERHRQAYGIPDVADALNLAREHRIDNEAVRDAYWAFRTAYGGRYLIQSPLDDRLMAEWAEIYETKANLVLTKLKRMEELESEIV